MNFKKYFNEQQFVKAAEAFEQMSMDEKSELLKELYYASRNEKMPVAVAVIRREINEKSSFDDFYNSWLPPAESMKPIKIGDAIYYQHFEAPVRVINACNINNEKDVISIGLNWCTKDEFIKAIEEIKASEVNAQRHDTIEEAANLKSVELFWVKTDMNLGT